MEGTLRGKRILVVEDNEINQQLAQELLESRGVIVTLAGDGVEALRIAGAGAFDAILMDVHMPEMDGYAAARAIRQRSPEHLTLPIIALTAGAFSDDRRKASEAGMNDYVSKPIVPAKLFATLRKWLHVGMPETLAAGLDPDAQALNARAALERAGGNAARLREVWVKFAQRYAAAPDEIAAALVAGNYEEARQTAHAIAGVAGNLGAEQVARMAQRLEIAIREQRGVARQADVRALDQALCAARRAIRLRTSASEAPPDAAERSDATATPLDMAAFASIFGQLGGYLEHADTQAIPTIDALAQVCAHTAVSADIERLRVVIKGYRFDDAFALWTTLAQSVSAGQWGT